MTRLLVRLAVAIPVAMVVVALRLALAAGRLGLGLLALAGFRGARLLGLAATGVGVWWAAAQVGLRPAVWLAVIGWAAWAVRHHRTAIAEHAAVRRLTATLQRHTEALAAAARTRPAPLPTTTKPNRPTSTRTAPVERGGLTVRPWPQAGQSPEQTVTALGRYAAAFLRRHTPPVDPTSGTGRSWRHPR